MFAFRDDLDLGPAPADGGRVAVAFTDASLDLQEGPGLDATLSALAADLDVAPVRLRQVHGAGVAVVADGSGPVPEADAAVTTAPGVALVVRVADCVPVVLADAATGVLGVAHAGRRGVELDVVTRTVEQMRALGATDVRAWVGPHVCGRCYEVPAAMRDEVAAAVPATYAETRQGTPALDLGAGVAAQLAAAGVPVTVVPGCTLEDERFHSYRRDGERSGRFAGLVWRR
ncbi:peptidoglycan editing factor PgeF [Nocardioides sp. WV_118_6]|uniref:peptidoglycan editing factor PgeF n=1 Tax=Nocardioides simplex TaxID=2045 RepID=UPI00214F629C|nr:peptidoglycan editing factor PgeF [Pimelobacter simplex]UUW87616.1 peptidoglycan editing factor PgeF [Pimelobacter simplex]UUW97122.1 peptidoglycan editing factor PgeF [Pimelobacter simplex]